MTPSHPSIRLSSGQQHPLHAKAGMHVVAQQGSVTVTSAARWLGDTMWSPRVVVRTGQAHLIDTGGGVTLHTNDAQAEVLCVSAPPSRAAVALHRLARAAIALARRRFA